MNIKVINQGKEISRVIINDPKTYNSLSTKNLNDLIKVFNKLDNDNKRERTLSTSFEFEIAVGGAPVGKFSPTLDLLPKYAFSQPPTGTPSRQ